MKSMEGLNRIENFNGNGVEQGEEGGDKQTVSVKERTQKFNRMASIEDELSSSPRQQKEKEKKKVSYRVECFIISAGLPKQEVPNLMRVCYNSR